MGNMLMPVWTGPLLQRLHREATTAGAEQEDVFEYFCKRLDATNVSAWNALVEAYEADPKSTPDPYVRPSEGAQIA